MVFILDFVADKLFPLRPVAFFANWSKHRPAVGLRTPHPRSECNYPELMHSAPHTGSIEEGLLRLCRAPTRASRSVAALPPDEPDAEIVPLRWVAGSLFFLELITLAGETLLLPVSPVSGGHRDAG